MDSLGRGKLSHLSFEYHSTTFQRRQWQPSPLLLPGESQGWGSLVGCHLWGCTESDTEATQQQQQQQLPFGLFMKEKENNM